MVLQYRYGIQNRPRIYKRAKRNPYSDNAMGNQRWDRVIAPTLAPKGGTTSTQKPGTYALAVIDPEKANPCIIPDISSYPTSVYSIRQSITVPTLASGIGGFYTELKGRPTYATEIAPSTDAAFTFLSADFSGTAAIVNQYDRHRVVGASIRVEHPGNDANNQGLLVGVSLTRFDLSLGSLVNMQNSRSSNTVVAKDGIYVTYRPVDSSCYDMFLTTDTTNGYGMLQVHWTGAAASQNMVVHVTIHYEGIQKIGLGEYSPSGQVAISPGEIDATCAGLVGMDCVIDGKSYTQGTYSKAASHWANGIGKGVSALSGILLGQAVSRWGYGAHLAK